MNKATFPRLKILELFEKSKMRHMTAEDVYRLLLADNMDIGLATVYRVLTQFEQAGLLERHFIESGKAVFEINHGKHHDHLVRIDCGRVAEFYDPEIERRQHAIAEERGFLFFTIAFVLPVFPTDLMNFVAGLTGISSRKFFAANLLGRLPSVIVLTLIGSHGLELSNTVWFLLALGVTAVYILGRITILRIVQKYRPQHPHFH